MKRSILVFLSFSKCRLKEMMSFAWIVCSLMLFHLLTTRTEKKCFLRSVLYLFFLIFAEWPLVLFWKNVSNGIAEMHLNILKTKTSMMSLRFLRSSKNHKCSFFNLVEFYLYPTVGTVLIHSVKPELTE